MASIKVSELPSVLAITDNDVLIINDENAVTSGITITNFTTSFLSQSLTIRGTVDFESSVQFSAASLPVFNSDTIFNQRITLNGPVTLGSQALIPLESLSNVILPNTIPNGDCLVWDNVLAYWKNEARASVAQGVKADGAVQLNDFQLIPEAADDNAAEIAGVVVGGIYRTGNDLKVRLA